MLCIKLLQHVLKTLCWLLHHILKRLRHILQPVIKSLCWMIQQCLNRLCWLSRKSELWKLRQGRMDLNGLSMVNRECFLSLCD